MSEMLLCRAWCANGEFLASTLTLAANSFCFLVHVIQLASFTNVILMLAVAAQGRDGLGRDFPR